MPVPRGSNRAGFREGPAGGDESRQLAAAAALENEDAEALEIRSGHVVNVKPRRSRRSRILYFEFVSFVGFVVTVPACPSSALNDQSTPADSTKKYAW